MTTDPHAESVLVDRQGAARLDATDPLAPFVAQFVVDDPDLCYLDGNSLGRLPLATRDRMRAVVEDEWGAGLVRSWDGWVDLPVRVGDRLGAALLGAAPGQTLVADSVTVNLFKLVVAALGRDPARRVVVIEEDEFPTDRYVVDGAARVAGGIVRRVPSDPIDGIDVDRLAAALDDDVAVVVLSLVSFRSAALADIGAVTEAVHRAGALVVWDLCHAVGAVPIDLDAVGADLAVGCTYKYMNAGPGTPAFLYVASRHRDLRSPIQGWFAQRDQFAMAAEFDPLDGAASFAAGTPTILGLVAIDEGVALFEEAGLDRVRAKGVALTSMALDLVDEWLVPLGFGVASPRDPASRGNHLTVSHPRAAEIGAAMVAEAGVVPDTRPPDRIRLGAAPLSSRFTEVWDGLDRTRRLVEDRFT
jgi:kynureninase